MYALLDRVLTQGHCEELDDAQRQNALKVIRCNEESSDRGPFMNVFIFYETGVTACTVEQ